MAELQFSEAETEWFADKQADTKAMAEHAAQVAVAQGRENERRTIMKILGIHKIDPVPPEAEYILKEGKVVGVKWPDAPKGNPTA